MREHFRQTRAGEHGCEQGDGTVKYMLFRRHHHAISPARQHDRAFLSSHVCPPFVAVRKQGISSLTSPTSYGGLSALITPPWPCSAVPTGIEVIPRCDVQGHEGWGIFPTSQHRVGAGIHKRRWQGAAQRHRGSIVICCSTIDPAVADKFTSFSVVAEVSYLGITADVCYD